MGGIVGVGVVCVRRCGVCGRGRYGWVRWVMRLMRLVELRMNMGRMRGVWWRIGVRIVGDG